jgi:hypothetical protein
MPENPSKMSQLFLIRGRSGTLVKYPVDNLKVEGSCPTCAYFFGKVNRKFRPAWQKLFVTGTNLVCDIWPG